MAVADKQSTDRRAQILDAAVAVISRRGVDRARLADVAEEAGVSLGLVQHYFRTRERLLFETFRREQERISSVWTAAVPADTDPLFRLVEYLWLASPQGSEAAVAPFDSGWSFWLEFWSKANRSDDIKSEFKDIYNDFAELFRAAVHEGIERKEFRLSGSTEDSADRLVSLIDGLAVRTLLGEIERDRMLALLLDALALELGLNASQRRRIAAYAARRASSS
ncbi:MAG TPA: TetR/AcrR family transcriptional regulator [Gaiellaceae bacterium]|nr:TetR/AcrR family transcriptional regulator [Gaiellaceae bacterium]